MNIAVLNRNGYKISHIARLEKNEIAEKVAEIARNKFDTGIQIDNLVLAATGLDEKRIDKIFNAFLMQYGFEDTMTRIIFPFLRRIGMLWQTGVVNPAQEHFVSNLIRQKLVLAIDGIIEKDKPDAKQFLLFLPEGELHEIGLLFYSYLIKKNGHKIIYLGQSVPLTDIENIINTKDCDYFITSFASNISGLDVYEYLHKLSFTCKDKEIVFSCFEEGIKENQKLPPNVKRIKDALHFKEMLMKIEQE